MHYLNIVHKGVVLVLGYLCVVFLLIVGASEMVNRWRLAEGLRPFFQSISYADPYEYETPAPTPRRK